MSLTKPETSSSADTSVAGGGYRPPPTGIMIALFALALLPMTVWYVVHHPDERHYTDGGIAMLQTGDMVTPRRLDSTLRFNKPILTYWCITASYWLLGIGPFASRLPFLLAGCGTIWVTYRFGKLVGKSENAGRWAALVAIGNLQIVLASTRSIPDILLCLFTTISCFGAIAVIVYDRRTWGTFAAFYVGLGMAVASKGVPAVIVVAGVVAGAMYFSGRWRQSTRLVHLPTMLLGALIGGGWFVAVYAIHGDLALSEFAHDQVGVRFEATITRRVYHFLLFIAWCLLIGLPWIIPLAVAGVRRRVKLFSNDPRQRAVAASILAGILVLATATAFCSFISSRYVLPVVPLCAVWLGTTLATVERRVMETTLQWLLGGVCVLLVAFGTAVAVANYQISHPWIAFACGTGFVGVAGVAGVRNCIQRRQASATDLGLMKLAAYPLVTLGLFHFLMPDDGRLIASRLQSLADTGAAQVQIIGKPSLASRVRVYDQGHRPLAQVEHVQPEFKAEGDTVVISKAATVSAVNLQGYRIEQFQGGIGRVDERDFLHALWQGSLANYLEQQRDCITLATRCRQDEWQELTELNQFAHRRSDRR